MCGFSGFVHFGEPLFEKAHRLRILADMGAALGHRGPDDEQTYDDGLLSLVFRRLAIVDPAGGSQPISSEDGHKLLVCNGEIYNHAEMRRALAPGHAFKTESDCEVLLHGYEQWGEHMLQKARGMFGMAIWDRTQRRLFLARDRLGIKPLYVCHLRDGILFGSELKALLAHPLCPRDMDWGDLSGNPVAHAATPSYVKNIAHLPGGHFLCAEPGKQPRVQSYWRLDSHLNAAPFGLTAQAYVDAFDHLLEEAVDEHLLGQAGFGLHLSGGVDSSLVAAIAGPKIPAMPAFTLVERSNHQAGDTKAARGVANALRMPWHPVLFDYRTLLHDMNFSLQTLEQSAWMMDSPLFDMEWLLKRELNRSVRTQFPRLKVLLIGQGADEFSGGYSSRIDSPNGNWRAYLNGEVKQSLRTGKLPTQSDSSHALKRAGKNQRVKTNPYHQMMLLMTRQLQHHNLWHEDRTSAAFGMEARVPFLDHRIVELLASVPAELHEKLFWNKHIVRQALHKRMPTYDLTRPKIGFCLTDDTRSLDIIIHSMALRAGPDFRDKYASQSDYPFERAEIDRLLHQITNRQPGFKQASVTLLARISATVFRANVLSAAPGEAATGHRANVAPSFEASCLPIIDPNGWQPVDKHFADQPVIPFDWQLDHCPRVPVGCVVQRAARSRDQTVYQLVSTTTVHAELSFTTRPPWLDTFICALNDPTTHGLTVGDWMARCKAHRAQLVDTLNLMLQCGIVTTPSLREQISRPLGQVLSRLSHRFAAMNLLPNLSSQISIAQCMDWLKQRRQHLMTELKK